jgi:ketopantoate reductase
METTLKGNYTVYPLKACDMAHYKEQPDVIFLCVKGYSLEGTIPFIKIVAHKDTVVIPLLNIFGTGSKMQELEALANTMGIHFTVDIVKNNLGILDKLSPVASTSLQRDLKKGKKSKIDGLIFEVVSLGKQYGVEMPVYKMIAEKYGFKT